MGYKDKTDPHQNKEPNTNFKYVSNNNIYIRQSYLSIESIHTTHLPQCHANLTVPPGSY